MDDYSVSRIRRIKRWSLPIISTCAAVLFLNKAYAAAPTIAILDEGDGGDGFVNADEAQHVVVQGTTSNVEVGRTVFLTLSSGGISQETTAIINSEDRWVSESVNISHLGDGVLEISADVSNSFGTPAGTASNTVNLITTLPSITVDAIERSANTVPFLSGGSDQPDGAAVSVFDPHRGRNICQTSVSELRWSCESQPLSAGEYQLEAVVLDRAGNAGRAQINVSIDLDMDDDGIPDVIEANMDSDGDEIPNNLDIDSDGDGILDSTERNNVMPPLVNDVDGDQIPDEIDTSFQEGDDLNNNGIVDHFEPVDTDGDSVPDYIDLDSDNDSLFDVVEAGLDDLDLDGFMDEGQEPIANPPNSDYETSGDSEPDYRDLDSDDDGISDLAESDMHGDLDDGTGVISDSEDTDGDGIADVVDGADNQAGSLADGDFDGVVDALDLDDDNDGLIDLLEGHGDFDADGIENRLDLDSDNDGIVDLIEGFSEGEVALGSNGRIADFIDENGDGLHDLINPDHVLIDTDGDGDPDIFDLDSDNDGIFDIIESDSEGGAGLDENGDGVIDSLIDVDFDGLMDIIDQQLPLRSGSEDDEQVQLTYPDLDNDGLQDFRDVDADGDGYSDALENGDFDQDGRTDRLQNDGGLDTGVTGYGSLNPFVMLLFFGSAMLIRNRRWVRLIRKARRPNAMILSLGLVSSTLFLHSPESHAFDLCYKENKEQCLYLGFAVGISEADPEGVSNGWRTTDDIQNGWQIYLGVPWDQHWFGEFSYADLGAAEAQNYNPSITATQEIDYTVTGLYLGYRLWPEGRTHNFFAKVGAANIEASSSTSLLDTDSVSDVQLSGSLGWIWKPVSTRWFGRAHFDVYDRDAHFLGFSIGYSFDHEQKASGSGEGLVLVEEVEGVRDEEGVKDVEDVIAELTPTHAQEVIQPEAVESQPVINPYFDSQQRRFETCRIFEGALKGVRFETNSSTLTMTAQESLQKAIDTLRRVPELIIEIQAHTDDKGSSTYNQWLSERRAQSVRSYLEENGLDGYQLTSKGYGESMPIVSNSTEENRAMNRRVQFQLINERLCY